MALTPAEREIVEYGRKQGKSKTEVKAAVVRYRRQQQSQQPQQSSPMNQGGVPDIVPKGLNTVFGGGKIGEAIGKQIAKGRLGDTVQRFAVGRDLSPEEEANVSSGPGALQVAGDTARIALNFTPVGKAAGLASRGLSRLGLTRGAQTVGNVAASGATGAAADVAVNVSEGNNPKIGLGALLAAGIPAASPVIRAVGRALSRLATQGAAEVQGTLTGTSAETIEQAFIAARKGGRDLDELTTALRGRTTPEQLVNNARESVSVVDQRRQELFRETIGELGNEIVETAPAKEAFKDTLSRFKVQIDDNGMLDFSNSELRTVEQAQSKLQKAWQEISDMPDTMPLSAVDTTRQAIRAIKEIAGDDPSANKANALIDDAARAVRQVGEQVEGYGQLLDNFEDTSEFLEQLTRGLSTGDKKTIDQAYRRLATTLRTNNEQRAALLEDLDKATDGALLSTVAGQQLSETLPRGIFRQIAAGIAGTGFITGGLSASFLPALVFASPRVTGEVIRALGISARKAETLVDAINEARGVLVKIGAIGGAVEGTGNTE